MAKRTRPVTRARTNPTTDLLAHRAFPAVADALRARAEPILGTWKKLVRQVVPAAATLAPSALEDGLPDILAKMADALGSDDPAHTRALMERSPSQGIARFEQHYDVRDVAVEDSLLRRLVFEQVADELGRPLATDEVVALNMALDGMLQQAVVAFVTHQNERLREAAEAELKHLSFLSHDLSGNLSGVTMWLQILKRRLAQAGRFDGEVEAVDAAQQAILQTIGGMGRLLEAERLRHQSPAGDGRPGRDGSAPTTDLAALAARVARHAAADAGRKGIAVAVEVPDGAVVDADPELVALVLQNLVGNAVKYSPPGGGTVRVTAEERPATGGKRSPATRWAVSVADQGPGIAAEHQQHIFEAFRRGQTHGRAGVGLGLTIAARAAKLLGAELTVESRAGKGSTFTVMFPPAGRTRGKAVR